MSTSTKQKQPRVKHIPVMATTKMKRCLGMEDIESDEDEVVKSVKLKPFFTEKGFKYSSGPNWGLNATFKNQIEALNWKSFAEQRKGYVAGMVREFYDLVAAPNQTFLIMRGGKVTFDAARINSLYGLEEVEDEYSEVLANLTKAQLNQMKKDLAAEGTPWIQTPEGKFKILRNQLKNEPKVWYHFIRHTLLPTAHNETVNQERLVLLHCIMMKKKINIGTLLREQLIRCAMDKTTSLLFPCMITQLCLEQGIEATEDEGFDDNRGQIDLQCIKRMSSGGEKPATEKKPAAENKSDAGESGKKPEDDPSDKEFMQKLTILLLQHMAEQQEIWTFLCNKHAWDLENLKANNWSYATPIPKFPKHVLKSLQENKEIPPTDKPTDAATSHAPPAAKPKDTHVSEDSDSTTTPPETTEAPAAKSSMKKVSAPTTSIMKSKRKASASPSISPAPKKASSKKKKSTLMELAEEAEDLEAAGSMKKKKIAEPEQEDVVEQMTEEAVAETEEQEEEEDEDDEEEVQVISVTKTKSEKKSTPPTRKSQRKK